MTSPAANAPSRGCLDRRKNSGSDFQGLTATVLYQFNVKVPWGLQLTVADASIAVRSAGVQSPDGIFLAVEALPAAPADNVAQIDNFRSTPDPINVLPEKT